MSKEKIELTDEEIDSLAIEFKIKHDKNDMIISYGEDVICVLDCKEKQYLKIDSSRNSLNKYLKLKGWCDERLIQKLKNSFITKRIYYERSKRAEKKKDDIKPDYSIKNLDNLLKVVKNELNGATDEFELCLYTVLSYYFHVEDAIYLALISPRGTGKSTLCKCFPVCEYIFQTDDVTNEALAPGVAKEDENVNSLLDDTKDKTLITHDMTALLSSSEIKVDRFFGILTNSYGIEPYRKYSPGVGLQEFGGWYNFIFGITPEVYYRNSRYFHELGRCLYCKLKEIDQIAELRKGISTPNTKKIQSAVLGFMNNIKKLVKEEKPEENMNIPKEIEKYIINFLEIYQHYKLVWKTKNKETGDYSKEYIYHEKYGLEGVYRPYNQIIMLCKTRAYLNSRVDLIKEDVDYFKKLFYGLDDEFDRADKLKPIENMRYKGTKLFDSSIYEIFDTRKDLIGEKEIKKKEIKEEIKEEVTEEELKELDF